LKHILQINEKDNVAVVLKDLQKGETIQIRGESILLKEDVQRGHKIAIDPISDHEHIIKYGFPIGHATKSITVGEHVHTHNIRTNLKGVQTYEYKPVNLCQHVQQSKYSFRGYRRKSGQVGIRNELWIVPTVGCVNGIAEKILQRFEKEIGHIYPFENALVLKHSYGCSQLGDDHAYTRTILLDAVQHANAGGVLVLGLGCENNNLYDFKKSLGDYDEERIKFLITQEVSDEIEEGVKLLKDIYEAAMYDEREPIPLSELKIGLKCGGSDGFSGITANPLLGKFSDFLVSQGGTTVLTEVPEMFGAETLLMERAANKEIFDKTVHLINDFKEYFLEHKQPIYENPSPGNKAGGITTLEDKSLGCVQKAGTSVVQDVLKYGERLHHQGLNLLSAPGNDLVSSTALGASGCHMVLFTTGRGTPFGTFVPTVKVSSNTPLYEKKPHWIDFNAGKVLEESSELVLEQFIEFIINVANGEQVNNERNNYREIAIFKNGVTL